MEAVYIVVMERTLQDVNLQTEVEAFSTFKKAQLYVKRTKEKHLEDKTWFKEREHFVEELENGNLLFITDTSQGYTVTLRIVPKLVK